MDNTALFYSRPSYNFHGGGSFPVFAGSRRQRGGGIFGSLKKMFIPMLKRAGKSLISHGLAYAKDVTDDAMEGKNFKESLIKHGKARAISIGKSAAREGLKTASEMVGKGGRHVSRKRKRRAKSTPKRKAKKRRRVSKLNF